MNAITQIAEAFDPIADVAAAGYERRVREAFEAFRDENGEVRRPGRAHPKAATFGRCARYVRSAPGFYGRTTDPLIIADDFLAKEAAQFGKDQVAGFVAKLEGKIGDLTDVSLTMRNNGEFTILGKIGDRLVRVEQIVVFKVSSTGQFFLQWPARIYVNGQFTPEKKFKEITGRA